ncbi:hypothetical protein DUI87_07768 [Hirundo rustica rustica]|uniref:Uncharacterized protein n=1 Tax=Hirundo rustica rustica TaxID=333673 RepID=A0A3M0KQP9_HIRRU|nr:hypothetical protein DUI87_07768 [Hirundo rustica rustica]
MCSKIMEQILLEDLLKYMKLMEDRELIKDSQHGFSKEKSCLTNFMAFSDGLTATMDKERATHVTYLDICKAFDMVPPNNIISELKRYGSDAWTVRRTRIWLVGCVQSSRQCLSDQGNKALEDVAQRNCDYPIPVSVQGQAGYSFEQPDLENGILAQGRTEDKSTYQSDRTKLNSGLTQLDLRLRLSQYFDCQKMTQSGHG